MRNLLNVLVLLCSIYPLHSSDLTESNLPSAKVRLFYDNGYGNSYLVNYQKIYKDTPLLGVLYVPDKGAEAVERLTTFYSQFMERNNFIEEDEMLSPECTCLFLSHTATNELQHMIGEIKPVPSFYLAADEEALIKKNNLLPHTTWLMLFMKGRLIYKESIGPYEPIPYF